MLFTIKTRLSRLRLWVSEKPKIAGPILGGICLGLLLLISTLVAVLTQEDAPQKQPPPISQQQEAQVTITKDGFIPASLIVKKGTKIVWTNSDEATHQLQANPHPTGDSLPGLKSEILTPAQTYEYTADTTGTFGYHDHLNPTTNGTIEVQE